jgi:4-diphosphocytidyl-2-C-methyl-D-erythritol kinase
VVVQLGEVRAVAPAKVNLVLRVADPTPDGYHPLVTVFQAVDLWDEIVVSNADSDELVVIGDGDISGVPTDSRNIIWRARDLIQGAIGRSGSVGVTLTKRIPVAGGMAGGSADAAAMLVALNELWQGGLNTPDLLGLASQLGADVPFSLLGGLALGEGRGDALTICKRRQALPLVVVPSPFELSTPEVYRRFDELTPHASPLPTVESLLSEGFGDMTPDQLASHLANDLEPAALSLAPQIAEVATSLTEAGALASMVSGSGPTVFGLCRSEEHADKVASDMTGRGFPAVATSATSRGARLISSLSSPREDH